MVRGTYSTGPSSSSSLELPLSSSLDSWEMDDGIVQGRFGSEATPQDGPTSYYCNCTCFGVKYITPSESYLFSAVWRWVVYNSEFFGDRLRGPKPMPTFSSASCRSGPHRHGPKTRTQSDFETKKCTVNCGKNQMMFSDNICFFPGFLRKTKHLTLTQLLRGENMLNMLRMP